MYHVFFVTIYFLDPIFETWLDNWNKKLSNEGRKILLYMDNFSGHTEMELSNIVIKFLPPNTTARTQVYFTGWVKKVGFGDFWDPKIYFSKGNFMRGKIGRAHV